VRRYHHRMDMLIVGPGRKLGQVRHRLESFGYVGPYENEVDSVN
jgi:hypothetical protein